MSGRRFFAINKGVAVTNEFDVRGFAVRLSAGGITGGDVVQVQVLAGEDDTVGSWSDLAYNGNSVQLTPTNSQLIFIVEGRYRVTYSGGNTNLQVWLEEDTVGLDQRSVAIFAAMGAAAGPTGPTGPPGPTGTDLVEPGISTVVTGTSANVGGDGISHDAFNAVGTIANFTLNLLDATIGGSLEFVRFGMAVTNLAITGNVNQDATRIVKPTPTSCTAGQELKFVWDDTAVPNCWCIFNIYG